METSKILSADLLDLIFDDRNKAYGAYELRKTYQKRITRALLITGTVITLSIGGVVMANSLKPNDPKMRVIPGIVIESLPDEKPPEKLPEPEKPKEPEQVRTEKLTTPVIVNEPDEPPPTQDELKTAKIGDFILDKGPDDVGIASDRKDVDKGSGIIENKKDAEPNLPFEKVEVEAKFIGDWIKFLKRNLRAEIPVENGAPAGQYRVVIQFVVDIDGAVSDIKPLTNNGYGMEEEAVRVLKKAEKWEPAFQNTKHVKAYRKQIIIFEVLPNE